MTAKPGRPVVAGVDGSLSSYTAVDWAAAEAQRRRVPLRLVHVVERSGDDHPPVSATDAPERGARGASAPVSVSLSVSDEITAEAAAYAHACVTDLDVSAETVRGETVSRLVEESGRAAVVVVGNRGLGGLRSLLAGSVSVRTAAHARCPMVVVRPHLAPPANSDDPRHGVGRVVVGVGSSALSRAALEFAFEEAALRGVGLTAVHAWRYPISASTGDLLLAAYERVDLRDEESELLTEALAPLRERYPEVPVQPVPAPAVSPSAALIHESDGAQLLVVGSHGRSTVATLLLGSVSHSAIHHAACPVAVIHG
jgi:nucleotide-binding universal stress UspA family protein